MVTIAVELVQNIWGDITSLEHVCLGVIYSPPNEFAGNGDGERGNRGRPGPTTTMRPARLLDGRGAERNGAVIVAATDEAGGART